MGMKRLTFLLLLTISISAQQRRNPFQYVEPPPAPVKRVATPVVVAPPQPPQIASAPAMPTQPAPPRFPYHFIGRFGHDDDPIVALVSDDRVVIAQAGDTIDGEFIVRSIGLRSIEIGFVSHPSTIRLQLDGWL